MSAGLKNGESRLISWVAVCIFLIDWTLKQFALSFAGKGSGAAVEFALFMNKGVAFSIELPEPIYWFLMIVAVLALFWAFSTAFRSRADMLPPLTFIAFGALSNLLDRVMVNATVDYLIFFGRSAINLADVMIVGGLLWLFAIELRREKSKPQQGEK